MTSLIKWLLSRYPVVNLDQRFIFVYHDISAPENGHFSPSYSVKPETFRNQVEFLRKFFDIVPLDSLVTGELRAKSKPLAALTFDDGFASVRTEAFPYLRERNIPFSAFVSQMAVETNSLWNGPDNTRLSGVFMDEGDIRFLKDKGVTIGSHTAHHRVLAECSSPELEEELKENKSYLEKLTGDRVAHLALPYGKKHHYGQTTLDAAFGCGHTYIYSTNPTYFGPKLADRKPIPRISLTETTNEEVTFLINRPKFKRVDI